MFEKLSRHAKGAGHRSVICQACKEPVEHVLLNVHHTISQRLIFSDYLKEILLDTFEAFLHGSNFVKTALYTL